MFQRLTGVAVAALALFAVPLIAQEVTCDDIVFDEAAMEVYPQAKEACLGVVELEGGERYVVMKAKVRQPAVVKTVGLSFQHQDGTWGDPRHITVSDEFRVMVGGEAKLVRDLTRGEEVNIFVREGRWTVAMTDLDVMEVPEEFHSEVVAAPVVLEEVEEAPAEEAQAEAAPAEEAPAEEAAAEEAPAEEIAEETPAQEAPVAGRVNWFWAGILAVVVVILFVFIAKRKKTED